MKAGQRILLIAYSLLVIAITVLFSLVVCGSFGSQNVLSFINTVNNNLLLSVSIWIIAVGVIIASFAMMFLGTRNSAASAMIKSTENVNINISIDHINSIAAKVVKSIESVRDTKISTTVSDHGININVKIALMSNAVVPEITSQIQKSVKDHIENMIGLTVSSIPVLVDNSIVASNGK